MTAGTRLGSYEIVGALGAGGMGEVYRARDTKLDRDVAIKVLPERLTASPDALARFEREAKAVAALSHPNILSIFDFGTHGSVSYAVMELLEGQTLREKIDAGAVSQRQAVDWSLQVAKGLSAAHSRGVVHRDLKPENVFVTNDGHVKILDFGLAKRLEAEPSPETNAPTGSGHTEPGTVMGTMGYMSPEQVRGLPVDHRSDIFSFGAILYELLSGRKAFKRDTSSDTIAAILKEDPPELTTSGRNVSPALDHVVRHCLEKDRENRFQTAKDVAFALSEASSSTTAVTSGGHVAALPEKRSTNKLAIVAAAVVLLVLAAVFLARRPKPGATAASGAVVKRIAVLPFENLGAPEDDYFADGIADQVRGKLTSVPGIEVIARGSSTPYKKTTKTPQEIAKELSANYLLTATVRWQKGGGASRVQVSPELVEIRADGPPASKWQQPFDASITDVFQVQSDIASKVAQALGVAIAAGQEKQLAEKPTQNLAAYDAFLKGNALTLDRTDMANRRQGLAFYEQAVELDPSFAQAWARLSLMNSLIYSNGIPTRELRDAALAAAEKAVSLAPAQADGYVALGGYYRLVTLDFARAREEFEKGLRLVPGNPELIRGLGFTETQLGAWEQGLAHLQEAARLDPRSASNVTAVGTTLLQLRRPAESRAVFEQALGLAPANLLAIENLALTHIAEGDLAGARASLAKYGQPIAPSTLVAFLANYQDLAWVLDSGQLEILNGLTPADFDDNAAAWAICRAQAKHLAGDAAGARAEAGRAVAEFDKQLRETPDDPQLHSIRGLALAYLGRKDEAIREGELGVKLGGPAIDALNGPYNLHQLIRIEVAAGENDRALTHLEALLKMPYMVTPAWLKVDPNFAPLRQDPRFQKLVAAAK
ncbi:MAG TPA: protein kinase [Thermoanaerobaculia bacterium]|nr:protein kinase [Thermoanaerobaculia bacterium]